MQKNSSEDSISTKTYNDIRGAVFNSIPGGIDFVIRHSKTTKVYQISEIVSSDKAFAKALREAPVKYQVPVEDDQGNVSILDQEAVKQKLLSRRGLPLARKFFDDKGGWIFSIHHTPQRPEVRTAEYKSISACFELKKDKSGSPVGYKVKNIDKLLSLVNELPTVETVSLAPDDSSLGLSSWSAFYDLAEACGVKPEGPVVFTIQRPDKDGDYHEHKVTASHRAVLHFMSVALTTLAYEHDAGTATNRNRSVVNVRNPEDHAIIGKPTVTGITDIIKNNAEKSMETLLKQYRTPEAQEADNGFEVFLNDKQAFPDLFTAENDAKTRNKIVKNYMAMQYRALVAFDLWKKDHPNEKEVKLSDLAKYTPWRGEVATKGLKPEHRNQLYNGLKMAGAYAYKYITGKKRKKVNGVWKTEYQRDYIYILGRIQSDKVSANGTIISVEVDYDPKYLEALSLNLGVVMDNLASVKTETAVLLGGYLCERFVAHQHATAVEHKPVRVAAATACDVCGITDDNLTHKYATLTKALNELVDAGVIGKWSTATGKQVIRAVDKESLKLDIWPKDSSVYITPDQARALKDAEKSQQKAWKKMLDEMTNPKKWYTNFGQLAKDLGITKDQLDLMLGGEVIEDEIGKRIEALYEDGKPPVLCN